MMDGVGLVRIGEKARPEAAFRFLVAFELFQQPSAVVEEDGTVLIGLQGCLPELQSAFWILKRFMAEPGIDGGSKEVGASRQGALERRRGVSGCPAAESWTPRLYQAAKTCVVLCADTSSQD